MVFVDVSELQPIGDVADGEEYFVASPHLGIDFDPLIRISIACVIKPQPTDVGPAIGSD